MPSQRAPNPDSKVFDVLALRSSFQILAIREGCLGIIRWKSMGVMSHGYLPAGKSGKESNMLVADEYCAWVSCFNEDTKGYLLSRALSCTLSWHFIILWTYFSNPSCSQSTIFTTLTYSNWIKSCDYIWYKIQINMLHQCRSSYLYAPFYYWNVL